MRESNPRLDLGKVKYYRYTNSAWSEIGESNSCVLVGSQVPNAIRPITHWGTSCRYTFAVKAPYRALSIIGSQTSCLVQSNFFRVGARTVGTVASLVRGFSHSPAVPSEKTWSQTNESNARLRITSAPSYH